MERKGGGSTRALRCHKENACSSVILGLDAKEKCRSSVKPNWFRSPT